MIYVGTSGYSYKEWKGSFYPEKLAAKDMLPYYSSKLPAVELNNTFYRLPQRSMVESWKTQVPENFRFSVKASQRITHFKRLKEASAETDYMLETVSALDDRLDAALHLFAQPHDVEAPGLDGGHARLAHDHLRRAMKLPRAAVVAKPFPEPEHAGFVGHGEHFDAGKLG